MASGSVYSTLITSRFFFFLLLLFCKCALGITSLGSGGHKSLPDRGRAHPSEPSVR